MHPKKFKPPVIANSIGSDPNGHNSKAGAMKAMVHSKEPRHQIA